MIRLQSAIVCANQLELVLRVLVKTRTRFMAFSIAAPASFPAGTSLSLAILTFASWTICDTKWYTLHCLRLSNGNCRDGINWEKISWTYFKLVTTVTNCQSPLRCTYGIRRIVSTRYTSKDVTRTQGTDFVWLRYWNEDGISHLCLLELFRTCVEHSLMLPFLIPFDSSPHFLTCVSSGW